MLSKLSNRQMWLRGVVGALIAAAINLGVALVAARLVDASPEFLALTPGPVVSVTVVTVLIGTAVYAVLNRLVARPTLVFSIIATVIALASLAAPIALSGDTSGTMAGVTPVAAPVLIPLHLIPEAVIVAAFAWRSRKVSA